MQQVSFRTGQHLTTAAVLLISGGRAVSLEVIFASQAIFGGVPAAFLDF